MLLDAKGSTAVASGLLPTAEGQMAQAQMRLAGTSAKQLPRKVSLTKTFIEHLECPADESVVVVHDTNVRGFCVRVTKGRKSFYLYRKFNGKPERQKLGVFPDVSVENARKKAQLLVGEIAAGKNPFEERRVIGNAITLEELFKRYQEDGKHRHTPKTVLTDTSRFETCFGDAKTGNWKSNKLTSITE